jgi:hypothetical protein
VTPGGRYVEQIRDSQVLSQPLIDSKEESLIFLDWTTEGPAKIVSLKLRKSSPARCQVPVIKLIPRVQGSVANEIEGVAVKVVRPV